MQQNNTERENYPNRIGYCIKKYGYTYTEVAEEISVSRRTLSYYISGERAAPRYCLEKIARLLGCEVEELIGTQPSSILMLTDEQKRVLSALLNRNSKLLTEGPRNDASDSSLQLLLQQVIGIPDTSYKLSSTGPFPIEQSNKIVTGEFTSILESDIAARWELYHTAGASRASIGLDAYVKEITKISQLALDTPWYPRMQALLTTGYQLQSCILRDLMKYRQAHVAYQKAFDIAQELDDPEFMASALQREGVTLIQQDKPKEAIIYLTGALNVIDGCNFPTLRVHIFQALSEANAKTKQTQASWDSIEQAEKAQVQQGQSQERSLLRRVTPASIAAQKGVNTVLLCDYDHAITLIDQSLKTYNPSVIRGRARLIVQKAEAFFGLGMLDDCTSNALEALLLARAAGSNKTIARVTTLYTALTESSWRKEQSVIQLGKALLEKNEQIN